MTEFDLNHPLVNTYVQHITYSPVHEAVITWFKVEPGTCRPSESIQLWECFEAHLEVDGCRSLKRHICV